MKNLIDKKILYIICGGISAYKSLETIRLFKKNGAQIKTILTNSAKEFITPLSVASLSQGKVYSDIFSVENETEMDHIALSRWADVILIAPATANTISKLAQGTTDDLASTVVLASNKEIYLAPAMNVRMWEHQSTKQNLKKLISYGYKLIGPEIGEMACGEYGEGKMSEPDKISNEINNYFLNLKKNKNLKALVTAGPTNEYIDPVRFITNKSSGKQGYEIAKSLSKRGFDTTLISGPTNLKIPDDIKLIQVETADEMLFETQKNLPANVAVFSAAVADFKINKKFKKKIKKQDSLNLNFEKNVDILNYVSKHNSMRPDLVIGFAAETDNIETNAVKKLKSFGYKLIGPNIGDMACGEYGEGKMSEPSEILNLLEDHFKGLTNLKKKRALVTAGPTQEFLDPVRYITNRSSGKQGYEIANSLNKNGFDTTLISGPSSQIADAGINLIKVKTAEDMFIETISNLPVDVAVFSAAVGDWKMKKYSKDKIKKIDNIVINLEKNIDILNNISNHNSLRPKLVIGFAAETENVHSSAKKKLLDKNCDWIIANDVSDETIGFESNENAVTIFYKNEEKEDIKKTTKAHLANQIVDRILNHLN